VQSRTRPVSPHYRLREPPDQRRRSGDRGTRSSPGTSTGAISKRAATAPVGRVSSPRNPPPAVADLTCRVDSQSNRGLVVAKTPLDRGEQLLAEPLAANVFPTSEKNGLRDN
jgi:hypothetical protein